MAQQSGTGNFRKKTLKLIIFAVIAGVAAALVQNYLFGDVHPAVTGAVVGLVIGLVAMSGRGK